MFNVFPPSSSSSFSAVSQRYLPSIFQIMSKEKGRWEPTTTRGSPTTNESDPALAMPLLVASVLVLIVFSFGFASIYYQCLKLRKALHRRQIKPELTPGELKSLQEQHKSSHEELAAEIQSLTQLQTQVTSQLVQLRQLVQMAQQRHQGVGDHDKAN
jgi:hypothetical protein